MKRKYQLLQAKKNLENGRMALNSLIGVELQSQTEVEDSVAIVVTDDASLGAIAVLPSGTEDSHGADKDCRERKKADTLQVYATILCGDGRKLFLPGYNFHSDMNPNYAVYATVSMPYLKWVNVEMRNGLLPSKWIWQLKI